MYQTDDNKMCSSCPITVVFYDEHRNVLGRHRIKLEELQYLHIPDNCSFIQIDGDQDWTVTASLKK